MVVQAAVADPTAVEGALTDGFPHEIISRTTEGALQAGRLLVWGTNRAQQASEIAALPAADVDAIATAAVFLSNALTATTILPAAFDGVINRDRIGPCRTLSFNFDADVGWDTPSGECRVDVYGIDAMGSEIKDTVSKANGSGAVALTTRLAFASVTQIDIEATNANTGAGTVGVTNDRVELSQRDYPGLACYRAGKEPNTAARNFADNEAVSILVRGKMYGVPEHAVTDGDDVYVRVLEVGADLRGQLTGMDGVDTPATYAKLAGAKWRHASLADAFSIVELAGV